MTVIVREPTVAAFDFDGTLTRGESFFRFPEPEAFDENDDD